MKYRFTYILASAFFLLLVACQQEEVQSYIGEYFVQFKERKQVNYSFVYSGSTTVRDTVWIDAFCSGGLDESVRTYRLEQKDEYKFTYHYDEVGDLMDSVLVKSENQAEPGVHYVSFDDPDYLELCRIEGNEVNFRVPVILLRDYSLKEYSKILLFEFVDNLDFQVGDPVTKFCRLVISDELIAPRLWDRTTFGNYGKVKHQLMIDVTGKRWDDEFIDKLTFEENLYYKSVCAKELVRINGERSERGEPPLMENPDNPKSVVEFP